MTASKYTKLLISAYTAYLLNDFFQRKFRTSEKFTSKCCLLVGIEKYFCKQKAKVFFNMENNVRKAIADRREKMVAWAASVVEPPHLAVPLSPT